MDDENVSKVRKLIFAIITSYQIQQLILFSRKVVSRWRQIFDFPCLFVLKLFEIEENNLQMLVFMMMEWG